MCDRSVISFRGCEYFRDRCLSSISNTESDFMDSCLNGVSFERIIQMMCELMTFFSLSGHFSGIIKKFSVVKTHPFNLWSRMN